jgi:ribonuclease P protein component
MAGDRRFPMKERLRLRGDFARVFAAKCSHADGVLAVYLAPNGLAWSRLGLSVSKRVGNAARRNYVRRRIREAFRTQKSELPKGLDIICVAKPAAGEARCELARSLRTLILKTARRLGQKGDVQPGPPGHGK